MTGGFFVSRSLPNFDRISTNFKCDRFTLLANGFKEVAMGLNQTAAYKPPVTSTGRLTFQQGLLLVLRLFAVFVSMVVANVVSGRLVDSGAPVPPDEASQYLPALLVVSLGTSLALAYPILRSRWYGVKLAAAICLVMFGVETLMSVIEVLYFSGALKIPAGQAQLMTAAGLVRALIFAPLAVLILGRRTGTAVEQDPPRLVMPALEWVKRFAILAVVYVVVYFGFGYFVAMQWAEVREFYAGTFEGGPELILLQLFRGVLWAALALPIVKMMQGKAWETWLAVAVVFSALVSFGLLYPNPFMPPVVRQAHFVELMTSMLTYGAIAGWVWTRTKRN
jgi:hypothetical protein